jgi:hypothetical protein
MERKGVVAAGEVSPDGRVLRAVSSLSKKQNRTMNYEDYDVTAKGPHKAAHHMIFLKDKDGNGWLCDKGVDPEGDLETQGCWRCEDMAFPMGI